MHEIALRWVVRMWNLWLTLDFCFHRFVWLNLWFFGSWQLRFFFSLDNFLLLVIGLLCWFVFWLFFVQLFGTTCTSPVPLSKSHFVSLLKTDFAIAFALRRFSIHKGGGQHRLDVASRFDPFLLFEFFQLIFQTFDFFVFDCQLFFFCLKHWNHVEPNLNFLFFCQVEALAWSFAFSFTRVVV